MTLTNRRRGAAPVAAPARRTELTASSPAGLYVSEKGTKVIKPSSNKGRRTSNAKQVFVLSDPDTNTTFFKDISALKGVYRRICGIDALDLQYDDPNGVEAAQAARRNPNHF